MMDSHESGVSLAGCNGNGPALFTDSQGFTYSCSANMPSKRPEPDPCEWSHLIGPTGSCGYNSTSTVSEESETKTDHKRLRIVREIIDTEITYQRHLSLVVELFHAPFSESGLIPPHVTTAIFGNVGEIAGVNAELLRDLRKHQVGAAFLRIAPFLKLYSTYANNHERALSTLLDWEQKCPQLSQLRRSQEDNPTMMGLKLNALLITPVQRVPRYKLLLQDLLSHTPEDHPDYDDLKEATCEVCAVATHINEHIRRQDNFVRMLAIERSLAGPSAPRLMMPGRVFIRDGTLTKISRKGGQASERRFYLFSDLLLYAKPRLLDTPAGGSARGAYACCAVLPLQHCKVSRILGGSTGQNSDSAGGAGSSSSSDKCALFAITCKDVSLLLLSAQKTVNAWITAINEAICALHERRLTLRKTSSAKEPLRRAALTRWTRRQRRQDPLYSRTKRIPERNSCPEKQPPQKKAVERMRPISVGGATTTSPATPTKGLDLSCLTPRSRKRAKKAAAEQAKKELPSNDHSSVTMTPRKLNIGATTPNKPNIGAPVWQLSGDNALVPSQPAWPSPIPEDAEEGGVNRLHATAMYGGVATPEVMTEASSMCSPAAECARPNHSTPQSALLASPNKQPVTPSNETPKRRPIDWSSTPAARLLCSPQKPYVNSPVVYGPNCTIQ